MFEIYNQDCMEMLSNVKDEQVDLVLIDAPYIISRKTGFTNYSENANQECVSKFGKMSYDFGEWDKRI